MGAGGIKDSHLTINTYDLPRSLDEEYSLEKPNLHKLNDPRHINCDLGRQNDDHDVD